MGRERSADRRRDGDIEARKEFFGGPILSVGVETIIIRIPRFGVSISLYVTTL